MRSDESESNMLNAIADIFSKTKHPKNLSALVKNISLSLKDFVKFDKVILAISNEDKDFDIFEYESGETEKKIWTTQGTSFMEVMQSGTPIVESNLGKYSQFFDMRKLYGDGYSSLAVFPLSKDTGAIAFASRRKDAFDGKHDGFLRAVAGSLAPLVYSILSSSIVDETRQLAELIFRKSSEAVMTIDPSDGKILSANQSTFELFDIPEDGLHEQNIYSLYPDSTDLKGRFSKLRAGGFHEFVYKFKNLGGEKFIRTRLMALRDEKKTRMVFSCKDVSEKVFSGAYTGLIQGLGDIIFSLDEDRKFLHVGKNINHIGYDSSELIGEPFATVVASKDNKLLNELIGWMKTKKDRIDGAEIKIVTKNDVAKTFLLGSQGFFDSKGELIRVYGLLRDIDSIKTAIEEGKMTSEIILNTSDAICATDTSGYIYYWNKAAEKLFGYSKDEIQGKDIKKIFPPDKEWEMSWALSEKMGSKPFETERVKKNGNYVPVRVRPVLIKNKQGKVDGYVEIMRDLRMENQLKDTEMSRRQLEKRNRYLKKEMKDKIEFISEVSHELRTPLTSIYGYSLLIQEEEFGPLSKEYKPYMDKIVKETERLRRFINDALELSRIESGRFNFEPQKFDLDTLQDKCSCTALAHRKGLYVKWEFEEDLPSVYGDPRSISQVLINLISNSIKFTESGGVKIKAYKKGRTYVQVDVIDTGEGIPESEKKNVFKRFRRVNTEKKREGSGLGLSITKKIIEFHGGKIKFDSSLGKGTRFYFILPIKEKKRKQPKA